MKAFQMLSFSASFQLTLTDADTDQYAADKYEVNYNLVLAIEKVNLNKNIRTLQKPISSIPVGYGTLEVILN